MDILYYATLSISCHAYKLFYGSSSLSESRASHQIRGQNPLNGSCFRSKSLRLTRCDALFGMQIELLPYLGMLHGNSDKALLSLQIFHLCDDPRAYNQ